MVCIGVNVIREQCRPPFRKSESLDCLLIYTSSIKLSMI